MEQGTDLCVREIGVLQLTKLLNLQRDLGGDKPLLTTLFMISDGANSFVGERRL